jgi:ubiquinone/menaquinone biosynthesis C-methylase UbiE
MMSNEKVKAVYNDVVPGKFGDDYEHTRWFKNPIQETGYKLTKGAITRHVFDDESLNPVRVLELGPGAATWTKLLVAHFPDAYFDLLDISKEMLTRAQKALGDNNRVRYIESDVLTWGPEGKYDYFFSSRVLEYIDDKQKFCAKIFSVLEPGGRGFLITKMPHYERERFLGRRTSEFHLGQIAPGALCDELRAEGFIDVDAYPVTTSIPFFNSAWANLLLGKFFANFTLGPISMFFAESYCVVFRAPRSEPHIEKSKKDGQFPATRESAKRGNGGRDLLLGKAEAVSEKV